MTKTDTALEDSAVFLRPAGTYTDNEKTGGHHSAGFFRNYQHLCDHGKEIEIMGQYWAAYHGQGLVLKPDEFNLFLKNYESKHRDDTELMEQIADYYEGDISVDDLCFLSASGGKFVVFCAEDGTAEGFRLIPYRINGEPNTEWKVSEDMPTNNVYVVTADEPIDGMRCFEKRTYASYGAFVDEFKDKMDGCLPEGFDWGSHVGIYSYAAFA